MDSKQPAHGYSSPKDQDYHIETEKNICVSKYGEQVLPKLEGEFVDSIKCPALWDGILCWADTATNTLVSQQCPKYIAGFDRPNNATKLCMENGQWFRDPERNNTWTNYTQCFTAEYATVVMELPALNSTLIEKFMPIIKIISKIGYSISFSTLVIALTIMICIKKLHCARNKLHMHLFASFIFRAFMAFLKDLLFIQGVGFSSDLIVKDGRSYFVDQSYINQTNNWECKMFTSFWQYFITANYSWILMEGLYLHNLILLALFSDSNNSITYYILLGWGLPLLVVIPWVIARLVLDDTVCWITYEHYPSTFLIIRIPTMISILLNLVLFINIARVLLSKLSSPVSEEAQRYRRWVRSTLVLVPLFGVHYAAFLGMSTSMGENETVEVIWLFCDQLFASFQGFFVAVLYCFLNGEVRAELCPRIKNFLSIWFSMPCCQYMCNCGEFRSLKGRASVCTTLSCSSLYTSGITHKFQNRKGRWNLPQQTSKNKNSVSQERNLGGCHTCEANDRSCPDSSHWNQHSQELFNSACCTKCIGANCFCANSIVPVTEMTACLDHRDGDYKPELSLDLEMISMAHKT